MQKSPQYTNPLPYSFLKPTNAKITPTKHSSPFQQKLNLNSTNRSSISTGFNLSQTQSKMAQDQLSYLKVPTKITQLAKPFDYLEINRSNNLTPISMKMDNSNNNSLNFSSGHNSPLTQNCKSQPNQPFTRTEQDIQPQKSDRSSHKLFQCINHPDKKAKYCVPNDYSVSLCSKCAIAMVGQGFKIQELNEVNRSTSQIKEQSFVEHTEHQQRNQEISYFLEKIDGMIPQFEKMLVQLSSKQDEISKYYEQQKNKIKGFFQSIIENVYEIQKSYEEQFDDSLKQTNGLYEQSLEEFREALNETQSMKQDIENNIHKIISQIENQPFRDIMDQYAESLSKSNEKLRRAKAQPIFVIKIGFKQLTVDQIFAFVNERLDFSKTKTTFAKKSQKRRIQTTQSINKIDDAFEKSLQISSSRNTNRVKVAKVDLFIGNKENQQEKANQLQQSNSSFEEGPSRTIEKEDIENSYNLMLGEDEVDNNEMMLFENQHFPTGMFGFQQLKNVN